MPFPPPGGLPDPGIEPSSLTFPALAGGFFTTSATWGVQLLLFLRVLTAPPGSGKGQPWRTSPVIQSGGGCRGPRTPEVVGGLGWGGASSASAFIPLHCTPSPAQRSVLYWTLTHAGTQERHIGETPSHTGSSWLKKPGGGWTAMSPSK